MARKRLSAPNPAFLEATGASGKALSRLSAAPIANVAGGTAQAAALEEMRTELTEARKEGRMIQKIALEDIDTSWIIRDRMALDEDEMTALKASIKARGQRTPIEVVEKEGRGYGLISGFRRVLALRALAEETGDGAFKTALAILRKPSASSEAYVAMIEENEIRAGLSYFERARIAVDAVRAGVFETEKEALQTLYANVSRSKRSKIKSFAELYAGFGEVLHFPTALGERLGLQLAGALGKEKGFGARVKRALKSAPQSADAEQAILRDLLNGKTPKVLLAKPNSPRKQKSETLGDGTRITLKPGGAVLEVKGTGVTAELYDQIKEWLVAKK